MIRYLLLFIIFACCCGLGDAQSRTTSSAPQRSVPQSQAQQGQRATVDLSEYGVGLQADPRLIIVMTALAAAGFDPTPAGREPSVFRAKVKQDVASLDPELRNRLTVFYERNKLPDPATAADQAARYVSLAFALGPPPSLDAPARTEELPGGLLEVLDFAPLLQEFYRRSGIDERLVSYTRAYQAEGDRLRQPAAEMVREVLSYLHTRPIRLSSERVRVTTPASKRKKASTSYSLREHERHFFIVPDLLAAPGAINLRVIGDEYYAVVPEGIDPASSELRRAYLQYVIDPLVLHFNREISARRDQVKQILNAREKAGAAVTPDVFIAVTRSLVAAADARFEETRRLEALARATHTRFAETKDEPSRALIAKETEAVTLAIQDETAARLAEGYERGAVLAFFFAEQLKDIESSGFDIANFFADMITSFDPAREIRRPAEYAEPRQRSLAAREARLAAKKAELEVPAYSEVEADKAAALVNKLSQIEQILRLRDYNNAEARLKDLLKEYPREPRIFFALAQTASLAAADATDENVQTERLNRALANYRLTIEAAAPEIDRALLSRAYEAMGRIHAFLDKSAEAANDFTEAIKIGEVRGGAYKEAIEGKKKLSPPK